MTNRDGLKISFVFLVSRLSILFFGYLSNQVFTEPQNLQDAFCQWDCNWYSALIERGYDIAPHAHPDGNAANWAFFPVFPKTVSFVSQLFKLNYLGVAYLLNNLVYLLGLWVLFLYAKKEFNEKIALTTILFMAFSPYSLYFSVPYTESFFFLFMVLTFFFVSNQKWLCAGVAAALLSGTRVVGVLIVIPMIIQASHQVGWKDLLFFKRDSAYKILLSLLLAPMGLFLYMRFLYIRTGDALAFSHIQVAWGREIQNPVRVLLNGLGQFGSQDFYFAVATVLGILISAFLIYKKRYAEFAIAGVSILIPLSTALDAMPRFTFTLFPIYISLALMLRKIELLQQLVLLLSAGALAFMSAAWVTGKIFAF